MGLPSWLICLVVTLNTNRSSLTIRLISCSAMHWELAVILLTLGADWRAEADWPIDWLIPEELGALMDWLVEADWLALWEFTSDERAVFQPLSDFHEKARRRQDSRCTRINKQHQAGCWGLQTMECLVFLIVAVVVSFELLSLLSTIDQQCRHDLPILVCSGLVGFWMYFKVFRKINEGLNPSKNLLSSSLRSDFLPFMSVVAICFCTFGYQFIREFSISSFGSFLLVGFFQMRGGIWLTGDRRLSKYFRSD